MEIKKKLIKDKKSALSVLFGFDVLTEVMCDTETDGLYGEVRLLQLYQPETSEYQYLFDMDYIKLDDIKSEFKKLYTVWQNASYDFGCLNFVTDKFEDTLWMAKYALPKERSLSLDIIYNKLFNEDAYADIDKKAMQKASFVKGARLSDKQLRYAALDVIVLHKVYNRLKRIKIRSYAHYDFNNVPETIPNNSEFIQDILAYKVDKLTLGHLVTIQQNGLVVHQESVRSEYSDAMKKMNDLKNTDYGINLGSTQQVKAWLDSHIDGGYSGKTDKNALIKLINDDNKEIAKFADTVFKFRRLRLRIGNLLKYLNKSIMYTRFNPYGATTGRFSAKGGDGLPNSINAQNITRDMQYIFSQDTDDTTVIKLDYSTAELIAGCCIMQDENMKNYILDGVDLHKVSAKLATGIPVEQCTKQDRQKGKAISFGFIFGMGWQTFIEYAYVNYNVVFSESEAKKIKKAYEKEFPNNTKYARMKWNTYKTKPNYTPQGRLDYAFVGTNAINFATQGCIAETIKLALHYLVKSNKLALKYVYNIVHDSMELRVPKGEEDLWSKLAHNAMIKGWKETSKLDMIHFKNVPLKVEAEYTCSITGKKIVRETSEFLEIK